MAFIVADRVKETTTTTGTGTVTLAGAVTGFRAFSAVCATNDTVPYCIEGTSEWEVGIGTYTLSGTTLARTTVLASSNSGSAVNFSAGTKNVFLTLAAAQQVANTPLASSARLPIRPPTTALFSLSNIASGATVSVNAGTNYYTIVRTDGGTAGERVVFQGKAVPAGSSWTATMGFWCTPFGRSAKCRVGLGLLESATLKNTVLCHDTENGVPAFYVFAWSDLTTFSSLPYGPGPALFGGRMACFFRVTYNGTNYVYAISFDFGETFATVATLAKASYFTTAADRIGVTLDTGTSIGTDECRAEIFYYSDPDFP